MKFLLRTSGAWVGIGFFFRDMFGIFREPSFLDFCGSSAKIRVYRRLWRQSWRQSRRKMPRSGRNCCDSSIDRAVCGGGKAHGVCCPGRDTAARRKKAFLASFLCLTKRMEKFRRGFYWFVRSCSYGALFRGLENLGAAQKDLIGLCEVVIYVRCSEVCRTSELPLEKVLIVAV